MFNPTHAQQLQASIEQAIHDLIVQSKTNVDTILERQTKIQQLKQTLHTLDPAKAEETAEDSDSKTIIEQARSNAIHQDCQTLVTAIDNISEQISQKHTKNALDLIEPFLNQGQLLKTRVQYVNELELLVADFEQEKQVRSRLQKIAAALDLPVTSLAPSEVPATPTAVLPPPLPTLETASAPELTTSTLNTEPQVTSAEPQESKESDMDTEAVAKELSEPTITSLSESTLPELEALLKVESASLATEDKLDFNKLSTSDISSQAKHLDFMLATPHSFDLDEEVLTGKSLQDDLDTLLMEAELLEKQANPKKTLSNPETSLFSIKYPFK